jgi:succinate dehydrogenase hydrophobic anchor subunit
VTFSADSVPISRPDTPLRRWLLRRVAAILLCVTSVLMSMIIIQQGRTIDSQRQLIHQLFQDSLALNAARMKLLQAKH